MMISRIWAAPAVQAALLQACAFPLTLICVFLLARAGVPVDEGDAAIIQGLLAAAMAWQRGLAPWWRAIGFVFPLALFGAASLAVPPWLYLAAFLFLLLLFWSTFRTQVPYYPSGVRAWDEVARLLPQDRPVCLVDIGSGLGGLVLDLARRRPESTFVGIEHAPLPWLVSWLRARAAGGRTRFTRGDYELLDFGAYDAVFAYLSPAAMPALFAKARAEMRPGGMLISYEFPIPGQTPSETIAPQGRGPALYVWHF
ncbi:MAG: class I SAM-dependent methyltransferase [Pseudomonadota bacterium]